MRERWDENAEEWIAWARPPGHDHFFYEFNLPAFLPLVPSDAGRCLDLGCGEGRAGRAVAHDGLNVIGIDGSPTLAAAATLAADGFPGVAADAGSLPIRDASFDLVVAFMSLHDIDDLAGTLNEAARVLQPGGTLCATIMHPMFSSGCLQLTDRETARHGAGSYYATTSYEETVQMNGTKVTLHSIHRPLQDHLAALSSAGFQLDTLREPQPTPQYLASHPEVAPLASIPLYLHYRAHLKR